MGAYITRRLLWTVLLLLVVSGITFIIFNVLPTADPALLRAGRQPTPELVAQHPPAPSASTSRCTSSTSNYIEGRRSSHFDFGRSYRNDVDVRSQLLDRLPNTLFLIARRRDRLAGRSASRSA